MKNKAEILIFATDKFVPKIWDFSRQLAWYSQYSVRNLGVFFFDLLLGLWFALGFIISGILPKPLPYLIQIQTVTLYQ